MVHLKPCLARLNQAVKQGLISIDLEHSNSKKISFLEGKSSDLVTYSLFCVAFHEKGQTVQLAVDSLLTVLLCLYFTVAWKKRHSGSKFYRKLTHVSKLSTT